MIKKILFGFSLVSAGLLQSSAQTATILSIPDTRNDATTPGQYSQNLRAQFKHTSSVGVPYSGSGYSTVLGFRGWYDNSGGKAHELAFTDDGSVLIRSGLDPNWEGWRRFLVENASGFVGVGTLIPQRRLDVNGEAMVRSNFYAGEAVDDGLSSHIFGPGRFGPNNLITFTSGAQSYYTTLQFKTGMRGLQGSITAYEGLWNNSDRHVYRTLDGLTALVEMNASGTNLNKLDAATSTATKFLVAEGDANLLKYRTRDEVIADLGIDNGGGNGWLLGGNSGTSASANFIGTIDNNDFALRTNNVERLRVTAGGNLNIGAHNSMGYGPSITMDGNSDNMWFSRYNIVSDQSELRVNIGDDGNDRFTIGHTFYANAQWTPAVSITANGQMAVGTTSIPSGYRLAVGGNIIAEKVKVQMQSGWADYVFEPAYRLRSLQEVERYIRKYKHLPEVPSAADIAQNGLDVGENQAILLKKIEELTLYLIELNKQNEQQSLELNMLKQQLQKSCPSR